MARASLKGGVSPLRLARTRVLSDHYDIASGERESGLCTSGCLFRATSPWDTAASACSRPSDMHSHRIHPRYNGRSSRTNPHPGYYTRRYIRKHARLAVVVLILGLVETYTHGRHQRQIHAGCTCHEILRVSPCPALDSPYSTSARTVWLSVNTWRMFISCRVICATVGPPSTVKSPEPPQKSPRRSIVVSWFVEWLMKVACIFVPTGCQLYLVSTKVSCPDRVADPPCPRTVQPALPLPSPGPTLRPADQGIASDALSPVPTTRPTHIRCSS